MNIEAKPKSAERRRGLALGKNINWKPRQPGLVICHGIGEKGPETAESLLSVANGILWKILRELADKYGFNIIWTQSSEENTTDEIGFALECLVSDLQCDPNKLNLLGQSWGGRRIKIFIARGEAEQYKLRTLTPIARGDVYAFDDAAQLAKLNLPTWFHHGQADAIVQESVTKNTYEAVKKINAEAPVYYSEYFDDKNPSTDEHNIMRYITDTYIRRDVFNPAFGIPAMSWYQWFEMNQWSDKPVSPFDVYKKQPAEASIPEPPKEEPPVIVEPPPIVKPAATVQSFVISFGPATKGYRKTYIQAHMSDGNEKFFEDITDSQVKSITIPMNTAKAGVGFTDNTVVTIDKNSPAKQIKTKK